MNRRLADPPYLAFPLRISGDQPELANRSQHIRGQIEQVLFSHAGERVFRPEFGAGVRALLFEPNSSALWTLTKNRLTSSLSEALQGEVNAKSIQVEVHGEDSKLIISVSYALATIGHQEQHRFEVGGA